MIIITSRLIKFIEIEKRDEYVDLAWDLKKQKNKEHKSDGYANCDWYTCNNLQGLVKELEDLKIREQVGTIQTIALIRLARILRRVLETWGDLLSLKLQW